MPHESKVECNNNKETCRIICNVLREEQMKSVIVGIIMMEEWILRNKATECN